MTGEQGAGGSGAAGTDWSGSSGGQRSSPNSVPGGDHAAGSACLNCGTVLAGPFCHACGQSRHVHRTLGSIGHDLLHSVFHFEGRIWRTLPMLVRRPGDLTRRYIAGERARFVSPLALFLFGVFLLFAVYAQIAPSGITLDPVGDIRQTESTIERQRVAAADSLAKLQLERADPNRARGDAAALDARIDTAREALAHADRRRANFYRGQRLAKQVRTGWPWLDRGIATARADPGLVAYKVQSSAYKYSWVLIALSTPFVALLFVWRRRFGLYDHAIFVIYSIGFMTLLIVAMEIAFGIGVPLWLLSLVAIAGVPAHIFAQLRGAYGLSILSATWRTSLLLVFAGLVLLTYVLGIVALGISH